MQNWPDEGAGGAPAAQRYAIGNYRGTVLSKAAVGASYAPMEALQLGVSLIAFVVLAALFALKMMGGGDVKLLTALALWIPPMLFVQLLIVMALVGGLLTIIMGAWHVMRRQRDRIAIPYGVAIAFGGLWVLGTHLLPEASAATGVG